MLRVSLKGFPQWSCTGSSDIVSSLEGNHVMNIESSRTVVLVQRSHRHMIALAGFV